MQFEVITIRKGFGELLLVAHEQNALQMASEVVQLLNHHLPAIAIEAAEAFVDDDALDWPMLLARVLPDAQSQRDRDTKTLAAAQESHVDRGPTGDAIGALQLQGLLGAPFIAGNELQEELTRAQTIENRIGVIDDLPLGLADEEPL